MCKKCISPIRSSIQNFEFFKKMLKFWKNYQNFQMLKKLYIYWENYYKIWDFVESGFPRIYPNFLGISFSILRFKKIVRFFRKGYPRIRNFTTQPEVVHWIWDTVMVIWPGHSLTHFSRFVIIFFNAIFDCFNISRSVHRMVRSTSHSQASTGPSSKTGLPNGTYSPSDDSIPTASNRPPEPGGLFIFSAF